MKKLLNKIGDICLWLWVFLFYALAIFDNQKLILKLIGIDTLLFVAILVLEEILYHERKPMI